MIRQEIIHEKVGDEERCPYLPGQRSTLSYRLVQGCSAESFEAMLERGWRRFGRLFFRPACAACRECRSLRLEVERFVPNRSMRRNLERNRDLRLVVRRPSLTRAHLGLYERFHADMTARKGWPEKAVSPFDYFQTFVDGYESFGFEFLFLLEGRLVAVALADVLPHALSAVYCYYEPSLRRRALGVYAVLRQIQYAHHHGLPRLYLGYWVEGNRNLSYKASYTPHQILDGRPGADQAPRWNAVESAGRCFPSLPVGN